MGDIVRIAVVGVGAVGLATSLSLTEQAPAGMDLTLFDPRFKDPDQSGRGHPYQHDPIAPMLNAPTGMMSVRVGDDGDFTRWVRHNRAQAEDFVSRPVFGTYLSETLTSLRRQWVSRAGTLHCVPTRVISAASTETGLALATENARFEHFDAVFLCVGWGARRHVPAGTMAADRLNDVVLRAQSANHVGVMGTGLTAVDVVRALLLSGYDGKITLASRRGLLPGVRSTKPIMPTTATREALGVMTSLDVRTFLQLIAQEGQAQQTSLSTPMRVMRGQVSPRESLRVDPPSERSWRGLFVTLCDEGLPDAWNLMDNQTRRVISRWLHPFIQAWCNPMPPATADLLAAALDSGRLTVRSGLKSVSENTMIFSGAERIDVDLVVSAHRSGTDPVASMDDPLVKSSIADGLAEREGFGGVRVEYGSWRLRTAAQNPGPAIYAIGSLAQGSRYYVSALDSILRTIPEAIHDAFRGMTSQVVA